MLLQCVDEASADHLFDQLRLSLGPSGPPTICIKPAQDSNGLGVVRATCGQDLQIYAQVRRVASVLWCPQPGEMGVPSQQAAGCQSVECCGAAPC